MAWTIYRFDDGSAPSLTNAAGSMIALLDAILVNGYGAKAAAGWSKVYSGTNKAVYRAPAGDSRFYFRVDDSATVSSRLIGYETMSDVDTGTNPFPTNAQVSGGLYMRKSADATARPWVVAADGKRLYVGVGVADTIATPFAGIWHWYPIGEFFSFKGTWSYSAMCMGDTAAGAGNNSFGNSSLVNASVPGLYLPRLNDETVGAIAGCRLAPGVGPAASGAVSGALTYPDPVSNGLTLYRYILNQIPGSLTLGFMPGVWHMTQVAGALGDTFSGSGILAGKSFLILPCSQTGGTSGRFALETSDTVET